MSGWHFIRSASPEWEHGIPRHDATGDLLHLVLDAPAPANILTRAILEELRALTPRLAEERNAAGLVVWSAKDEHFIAGADIDEIASVANAVEGRRLAALGQSILHGLSNLPFPTFGVIHGTCLGGGLELALALDYRIAVDRPATRIGLPEVNLGIIPGFGGTQRLPRLIGLRDGLALILGANRLPARAALAKGVVDVLVPPEGFRTQALAAVRKILADRGASIQKKRRKRRGGLSAWLLERTPIGRALVMRQALRRVIAKTGGHYPAPLAAVRAAVEGFRRDLPAGLALEADLCGPLVAGEITRNLIAIFQSSEESRRLAIEVSEGDGKLPEAPFAAVLGTGVMGAGIGALLLENGIETRMRDLDRAALARGLAEIAKQLARHAAQRRLSRAEIEALSSRLTHTTAPVGFARIDVVIEAIIEKLAVKRAALAEMEALIPEHAIFATNTSALRVTAIQSGARHPERVVGLHFFNPVQRMPLVEVIPGERTDSWAVARAVALAQRLGKFPVVVKDSPGFLVNRLLMPYLDSACRLLMRGVDGRRIDAAAVAFGLPMGPFRLLDEVGIDIAVEVGETLHNAFGERAAPAPVLGRLHGEGRLGRKKGLGFYRYATAERAEWDLPALASAGSAPEFEEQEIASFLLDRMVDEAARCLEGDVVRKPSDVDLALVMGTGFPPFRGGLLRYSDRSGIAGTVARLEKRAAAREACAPSSFLRELAREGRGFYEAAGESSVRMEDSPVVRG